MGTGVVAVDMDGTFLRSDKTYDRERFLRIRQRMRELGVRFVVASGNQVHQLRSFFEPADDVAYVAENGHLVFDAGESSPTAAAVLEPAVVSRVLEVLERGGHPYITCGQSQAWVPDSIPEWGHDYFGRFYHRMDKAGDLRSLADPVMKFALVTGDTDPVEVAADLAGQLGDVVVPAISGDKDVDLNAPGWHKASGLQHLLDRWGVRWDQVVAFGDSGNDLELVAASGRGYAMAEARDELVAVATHRAPDNDADGVLSVVEELLG